MTSPALPILGLTLLNVAKEKSQNQKRRRVGVSFDSIDSALKGGVDYGRTSCISGDKSQGKTTVRLSEILAFVFHSYRYLITSLLNFL